MGGVQGSMGEYEVWRKYGGSMGGVLREYLEYGRSMEEHGGVWRSMEGVLREYGGVWREYGEVWREYGGSMEGI